MEVCIVVQQDTKTPWSILRHGNYDDDDLNLQVFILIIHTYIHFMIMTSYIAVLISNAFICVDRFLLPSRRFLQCGRIRAPSCLSRPASSSSGWPSTPSRSWTTPSTMRRNCRLPPLEVMQSNLTCFLRLLLDHYPLRTAR